MKRGSSLKTLVSRVIIGRKAKKMKLYKARELAKLLRVHPKTIYRLGREGKIKRVKTGRAVRFVMPEEE